MVFFYFFFVTRPARVPKGPYTMIASGGRFIKSKGVFPGKTCLNLIQKISKKEGPPVVASISIETKTILLQMCRQKIQQEKQRTTETINNKTHAKSITHSLFVVISAHQKKKLSTFRPKFSENHHRRRGQSIGGNHSKDIQSQ